MQPGQSAYCPVSGVVFQVNGASPRRQAGGSTVYLCCEACAAYFSQHPERVLALRGFHPGEKSPLQTGASTPISATGPR